MRNVFVFVFFMTSTYFYSQNIPIYIFKNRYDSQTLDLLSKSSVNFKEIKIMLGYMVDPDRTEAINYISVKKTLESFFPDIENEGVLCIDWENKLYQNIRGNNITRVKNVSDNEYLEAEKEFVKLIKYVKKIRPNIKVGIFEMPFRVYDSSEIIYGTSKKLDPILKHVDLIFPCIYIPLPADKVGIDYNFNFLRSNLDLALNYGERLNKPVIPFFWYLYYSPDKNYRYELIPKIELWQYLEYIENYTMNNISISGIVWWDTPSIYSKGLIKKKYLYNHANKIKSINDVFNYYFQN